MGTIYTKGYASLEVFARSCADCDGAVIVTDEAGTERKYSAGKFQYRLLRIPMKKEHAYDVSLRDCTVSAAYLSECEDIMDRGVCFLEYRQGEWLKTTDLGAWYDTPGREQYHFGPYKNWINDPNGLCWYKGYYHMYYQANPHGQEWSHMYWGHAASRDCVHWVHLPYVLEPQEEILNAPDKKGGAFSGSAVVLDDRIRFYLTRHFGPSEDSEEETVQYQTMVESRDSIHFGEEKKIIEKPDADFSYNFRDPKVIWYDNCWQMVIGAKVKGIPSIVRYLSDDGENWRYSGILLQEHTQGVYTFECPDMFELDGQMVIVGAWMCYTDEHGRFQPTRYYVGKLKDGTFEKSYEDIYDFAGNFYAVQSFEHEGRRIAIGWVCDFHSEHCPEENGAYGSMALPRELHVRNGVLYQRPIEEVYGLKGKCLCSASEKNINIKGLNRNSYYAKLCFSGDTDFEILLGKHNEAELWLTKKGSVIRLVSSGVSSHGGKDLRLTTNGVDTHLVDCASQVEKLEKLEIFMDRRLAEVFINDGERAAAKLFYHEREGIFQAQFAEEKFAESIEIYEMKGVWNYGK